MDIHGYPHGYLWVSIDIHGYPWISIGYPLMSMDIHEIHGHQWISHDIHCYPWNLWSQFGFTLVSLWGHFDVTLGLL